MPYNQTKAKVQQFSQAKFFIRLVCPKFKLLLKSIHFQNSFYHDHSLTQFGGAYFNEQMIIAYCRLAHKVSTLVLNRHRGNKNWAQFMGTPIYSYFIQLWPFKKI